MKTIPFECNIITPMFMAGSDGRTPELRPPSIKGVMRFWWRAMNGHLSLEELRKEEEKLFGSSDEKIGRSKFSLVISDRHLTDTSISLMPHHENNFCSSTNSACYDFDSNKNICKKGEPKTAKLGIFSVKFLLSQKTSIDEVFEQNLFIIITILGGFGKRSRRGFGSVEITKINGTDYKPDYTLDGICKILNSIVPDKFEVQSDNIIKKGNGGNYYPFIKEIQIGKGCEKYEELLRVIGKSSHNNNCDHTGFVDMDKKKRFSSPIIVSVIKDNGLYKPIITSLHTVFENGTYPRERKGCNKTSCERSAKFIADILNNAGGCDK